MIRRILAGRAAHCRSWGTAIARTLHSPASTSFIALVRAANVGGTGKLTVATLKSFCNEAGFDRVSTYITSGNVVFRSQFSASEVRQALEMRLARYAGKPVPVIVRTGQEMAAVLAANPFPQAPRNTTVAIFLQEPPPGDAVERALGRSTERLALGVREIYVAYGERMGDSRLRFRGLQAGTARNMNTIAKLASMVQGLGHPDAP